MSLCHHPHWPHSAAKTMLQWHHNERDCVSNHQPHDCLPNHLFGHRSKKTSKLRVTGLCTGNSPETGYSPHKWPVTRKMFPFDDVIMDKLWRFVTVANIIHVHFNELLDIIPIISCFLLETNLQTRHLASRPDNGRPAWWRHQMETFSALLAFCAGNLPVTGESHHRGQWRGAFMYCLIYAQQTVE